LTRATEYVKVRTVPADADLVSTRDAATILDRPVSTVHLWIDNGRLVPVVRGAGVRGPMFFARADVETLRDELAAA
jgi:hypothetical protein